MRKRIANVPKKDITNDVAVKKPLNFKISQNDVAAMSEAISERLQAKVQSSSLDKAATQTKAMRP